MKRPSDRPHMYGKQMLLLVLDKDDYARIRQVAKCEGVNSMADQARVQQWAIRTVQRELAREAPQLPTAPDSDFE